MEIAIAETMTVKIEKENIRPNAAPDCSAAYGFPAWSFN
jgi:hypothetical protein